MQNRINKKHFIRNVASGSIQQFSRILVGFFMLPYAMHRLGEEEFGLYQIAFSVIVLFNFLQIGLGPTLVRFSSQALANDKPENVRDICSSGLFVLSSLGVIGMTLLLLLTPFFLNFYSVPNSLIYDASGLCVCLGFSFFLSFLAIAKQNILLGANRYDLSNGVIVLQNVSRAGLAVFLFETIEPSLFHYGLAILISHLLRIILLSIFVFNELGSQARFSIKHVNMKTIKMLLSFSLVVMINSIAYATVFQSPSLIIGKLIGVEMVALFAPALLVATSMQSIIGQSLNPIITLAATEKVKQDGERLGYWTVQISQLVACAGFGFLFLFFLYGEWLVGLWLGDDLAFLWKTIAAISVGAVLLPIQGVTSRMVLGAGKMTHVVISGVMLAAVIVLGTICGIRFAAWGIQDIAVFMGASIFIRCLYLAYAYANHLRYDLKTYLRKIYLNTFLVSSFVYVCGFSMKFYTQFNSQGLLIIEASLLLFLYGILSWYLLFPPLVKSWCKQAICK